MWGEKVVLPKGYIQTLNQKRRKIRIGLLCFFYNLIEELTALARK